MQTIFIMVKCELGKNYDVADELVQTSAGLGGCTRSPASTRPPRQMLSPQDTDIGHFVASQTERVPGIKDTYTIITFKAFT